MEDEKNEEDDNDLFDIVKKHLLDNNVFEEAEESLLRTMLAKPKASHATGTSETAGTGTGAGGRNKAYSRTATASVISPRSAITSPRQSEAAVLDALKISDLLNEVEEALQPKTTQSTQQQQPLPSSSTTAMDASLQPSVEELEKLVEKEIWHLEQKKIALRRQLEDRKADEERARILQDLAQPREQPKSPRLRIVKEAEITAASALQQKVLQLSKEHHEIIAQQQAQAVEAQRELLLLRSGKWTPAASTLLAAKLGRKTQQHDQSSASNSTSSHHEHQQQLLQGVEGEEENDVSTSEKLLRKARIGNILSKLDNEEIIQQRKQRIEELRNKEKFIERLEEKAASLIQNNQAMRQQPKLSMEQTISPLPMSSLVTEDGRIIDSKQQLNDFLDQWLAEEIRPVVSNTPSMAVEEQSKEVMKRMASELRRLQEENSRFKAASLENPAPSTIVQSKSLREEDRKDLEGLPAQPIPTNTASNTRPADAVLGGMQDDRKPTLLNELYPPQELPRQVIERPVHLIDVSRNQPGGAIYSVQPPYNQPANAAASSVVPSMDPMQQMMLMQMQKIAEQIEKENHNLVSLSSAPPPSWLPQQQQHQPFQPAPFMQPPAFQPYLNPLQQQQPLQGLGPQFDPRLYNPLVADLHNPAGINYNGDALDGPKDGDFPFKLQRDDPFPVRMGRLERQKQEEIRLLQYELEKLKHQKELEDFRLQYETQRNAKLKEEEHKSWLDEQKRELQAIKMKQVLLKEQRLLQFQEDSNNSNGHGEDDDEGGRNNKKKGGSMFTMMEHLREECGVGLAPVPIDLAKGMGIIIDGCLLRDQSSILQQAIGGGSSSTAMDTMFRIAVGVYDRNGEQAIVRLLASSWQAMQTTATSAGPVQLLDKLLMLSLSSEQVITNQKTGMKCLVELQMKTGGGGEGNRSSSQRSLGWAVLPLLQGQEPAITLANNAWRVDFRSGLTDPKADASAVNLPSSDPQQGNAFFIRILDSAENYRGSGWKLSDALEAFPSLDLLKVYTNANANTNANVHANVNVNANVNSGGGSVKNNVNANIPPIDTKPMMVNSNSSVSLPRVSSRAPPQFPTQSSLANMSSSEPGTPVNKPVSPSMKSLDRLGSMTTLPPLVSSKQALVDNVHTSSKQVLERVQEEKEEELLQALASARGKGSNHLESSAWWYLGPPLPPCTERYQRGDGVDIYIDHAMFLPDNTTLTRVSLRIFSSGKEQIGPVYESYSLPDSSVISPIFKMKVEYRGNQLNTTAIALIRFDTLDASNLVPGSIGYACIKLFASRDRIQPKQANDSNAFINTGAFQLPIYGGRIPNNLSVFDETMLSSLPRIPCATLLVRVLPAPKSPDGISTLSRDEFPSTEWNRLGLEVPAPSYASGAYHGTLCEPSALEIQAFEVKASLLSLNVESAIVQAMNSRKNHDLPERPSDPQSEAVMQWLKSLLPPVDKMKRLIDYTLVVPYSVESGLAIKIVQLYNMPEGTIFSTSKQGCTIYKVVYSLSPPALLYKDPPLFDGVHFTRSFLMDSFQRAPCYTDSYVEFIPAEMTFNLCLVLDVRIIRIDSQKKRMVKEGESPLSIKVESPGLRKSYWTLLPLARERCVDQGFRYCQSGYFQLPLIEGTVPMEEILRASNPFKEVLTRLSLKKAGKTATNVISPTPLKLCADFSSLLIKVYNPLLRDLVLPDLDPPDTSKMIPDSLFLAPMLEAAAAGQTGLAGSRLEKFSVQQGKYAPDSRTAGKTIAQALPANLPEDCDVIRSVNNAFTAATGIPAGI
eukprot:gene1058-1146_t